MVGTAIALFIRLAASAAITASPTLSQAARSQDVEEDFNREQISAVVLPLMGERLPRLAAHEELEPEPPAAFATIISVDVNRRTVYLSHEPIPDINWPPMLMELGTNPTVDLSALSPGTRVRFSLTHDKNYTWIIDEITPIPDAKRAR